MVNKCLALVSLLLVFASTGGGVWAADPILRLEPGGPISFVSGLAFGGQGTTLYASSWDKVVHVWILDAQTGRFGLDRHATYRVPVGPGLEGVLNAVAVSPDGSWLATAGQGRVGLASDLRHPGFIVPELGGLNANAREEQGLIHVFDTRQRTSRCLRGHYGPVVALAFAPTSEAGTVLISAAKEWDFDRGEFVLGVRAWDVARGEPLGGLQQPFVPMRPALAVWRTGPGLRQVRVAMGLGGDRQVHFWDLSGGPFWTLPDVSYNNALAFWPAEGKLISGGGGRLRLWNVPADPSLSPQPDREIPLPEGAVPRAMSLVPSGPGLPQRELAVVLRFPQRNEEDEMALIDLATGQLSAPGRHLWNGRGTMPALAASEDGKHLAVAGGAGRELLVLAVNDLRRGQPTSPQPGPAQSPSATRLEAQGVRAQQVGFARREGRIGLRFNEVTAGDTTGTQPQTFVFDPARRQIAPSGDWQAVGPDQAGWQLVRSADGNRLQITVVGPNGSRRLQLPAEEQVTATALLAPHGPVKVPIVAVASHQLGQPYLRLYDGTTGFPVRSLQGHVERIAALAFNDDGRLLLSGGDDRVLCVWSLLDLGEVIGRRGALPEVAVEKQGDRLVVASVPATVPTPLRRGDVLLGTIQPQGLVSWSSPLDFYMSVSRLHPGENLRVQRQSAGGVPEEVTLKVGQGVDERKPLFSLFLKREGPQKWQWIGWSPLGPFDASAGAVEHLLGWHFNPERPDGVVRYAASEEYRQFHRRGILEQLLAAGRLVGHAELPLPRPDIQVWLETEGQPPQLADGTGPLRVAARKSTLRVSLTGPAAEKIAAVTARLADRPELALEILREGEWRGALSLSSAERRDWPLTVTVRTREAQPQEFHDQIVLRHQPAPPQLEVASPMAAAPPVQSPMLKFRVHVAPSDEGNRVELVLTQSVEGKAVVQRTWTAQKPMDIEESLELQPGMNRLWFQAMNEGASAGNSAEESTTVTREIVYNPGPTPPPQLALTLALPDRSQRWDGGLGRTLVVGQPALRLEGEVRADEPLTELVVRRGDGPGQSVRGFQPGQQKRSMVGEPLLLEPGIQRVRVVAKATRSVASFTEWTVNYQPPLPHIRWAVPAGDSPLQAGPGLERLDCVARWEWGHKPAEERPFQAVLLVNGTATKVPARIDRENSTLNATAELSRGDSQLQWQLMNQWGALARSDVRHVRVLQPPRVVMVVGPAQLERPLADLTLEVETSAGLPLLGLRVGDHPQTPAQSIRKAGDAQRELWEVVLRDVPLDEGLNRLAIAARNVDGWSPTRKVHEIRVVRPPPPKAEIVVVSPANDTAVDRPQLKIRFTVHSSSRIESVAIQRAGEILWHGDPQQQRALADGRFELLAQPQIDLTPATNVLEVVAINAGGVRQAALRATYVPPPLRIVVDRLEGVESGETLKPGLAEGGRPVFRQAAPESQLWLYGRLEWSDAATRKLHPAPHLEVRVNGFLQSWVPVGKKDGLQETWRARIRLNQAAENRIQIEMPGLQQDAASRALLAIDCRHPDDRQRLHLLVVGVDQRDPGGLLEKALEAVQGRRGRGNFLTTPAFPEGRIYGPLIGDVSRAAILNQLMRIRIAIRTAAQGNDVVMMYYRGSEAIQTGGQFFLLSSESRDNPDLGSSALSGQELDEVFGRSPGAQVILLDVQRRALARGAPHPVSPAAYWPERSRIAAMRCAWLRGDPPPEDVRVLTALEDTLPKASRLQEISTQMSSRFAQAALKYRGDLAYDQHIPVMLDNLILGRRR